MDGDRRRRATARRATAVFSGDNNDQLSIGDCSACCLLMPSQRREQRNLNGQHAGKAQLAASPREMDLQTSFQSIFDFHLNIQLHDHQHAAHLSPAKADMQSMMMLGQHGTAHTTLQYILTIALDRTNRSNAAQNLRRSLPHVRRQGGGCAEGV